MPPKMPPKKVKVPHVLTPNQKKYIAVLMQAAKDAKTLSKKYERMGDKHQSIADKTKDTEDHIFAMKLRDIGSRFDEVSGVLEGRVAWVKQQGWVGAY